MRSSRRDFLKKAAFLAAGGGLSGVLPASIRRALAINPQVGSTFLDAEHIVILMQENRSFDHCYGALQGVRGFNDPRAIELPNGNPVWFQTNAAGETYAPFRLNIKESKATWTGSLPHGWIDQSLARNEGWHDRWLSVKSSGHKEYSSHPLTLGHYNREDIPFYYGLADAFTICDQNFCSSLTGTTPNRLHLWTGTLRAEPSIQAKACVSNSDADFDTAVSWKTFPERLEEAGVSWCVYQNEVSIPTGLDTDSDAWLANFGDNPLEYFTQYGVRFSPRHREHLQNLVKSLPQELAKLEAAPQPWSEALKKQIKSKRAQLEGAHRDLAEWTEDKFAKLPASQRNIHRRAFITNEASSDFRELATINYQDGGKERQMQVPKGDVFHQFRQDVRDGKLPTVSWLVAPENFSDHPSAPWYGAWYVSEALDILTQNPEVWKKTIFILCYDENDGYFDHIPPFVPPVADRPETGKVSAGIDTSIDHAHGEYGHTGPIGLGYRVPLVIASPWSRGGYVCSQVFDHTSILRLLEKILTHRTGRPIREANISEWRRTVCGDLSSVFRPYNGEKIELPQSVERERFLESIHQAQFKPEPNGFRRLEPADLQLAQHEPARCEWLPRQESGTRPSCPLAYDLTVDSTLSHDRSRVFISFMAGKECFGDQAVGAPFYVYDFASGKSASSKVPSVRFYAVAPGDRLEDAWNLESKDAPYDLRVHGPNGFYRRFSGSNSDPAVEVTVEPTRNKGTTACGITIRLTNHETQRQISVSVEDAAYGSAPRAISLGTAGTETQKAELSIDLSRSHGWYDLIIRVQGALDCQRRYAGRVETGRESITDPVMGRV